VPHAAESAVSTWVRAVEAVKGGKRPEAVAATFELSRSTVFGWLAQYRAGGWNALEAKPIPGRPPKIKGSQIERICKTLAGRTPQQYRFEFALWTLDLVRWLIAEEFGIRLSKTSTWRLMKTTGAR
jgi:transposase